MYITKSVQEPKDSQEEYLKNCNTGHGLYTSIQQTQALDFFDRIRMLKLTRGKRGKRGYKKPTPWPSR